MIIYLSLTFPSISPPIRRTLASSSLSSVSRRDIRRLHQVGLPVSPFGKLRASPSSQTNTDLVLSTVEVSSLLLSKPVNSGSVPSSPWLGLFGTPAVTSRILRSVPYRLMPGLSSPRLVPHFVPSSLGVNPQSGLS
jgi:hypothetical protein